MSTTGNTRRFAIAVSFPGEHRQFVRNVVDRLAETLGRDRIFFDEWYEAELLGLDGDLKLRKYYREQSELVVPFFSEHYAKPWCQVEWSATRAMLLERRKEDAVVPVQMDLTEIPGWEANDFALRRKKGSKNRSGKEIAELILQAYQHRLETAKAQPRPDAAVPRRHPPAPRPAVRDTGPAAQPPPPESTLPLAIPPSRPRSGPYPDRATRLPPPPARARTRRGDPALSR